MADSQMEHCVSFFSLRLVRYITIFVAALVVELLFGFQLVHHRLSMTMSAGLLENLLGTI